MDSCSDPELRFMSPKQCGVSPNLTDSLLSDRDMGDIGEPVTSSTPISITSSEDQLSSPVYIQGLNIGEVLGDPIYSNQIPESTQKGRRLAWQQERQEVCGYIQ